jgi:hypothetical protein
MRKIHCAGCGLSEPLDAPEKIKRRTLTTTIEGSWTTPPSHSEDLCDSCHGTILTHYFHLPMLEPLDAPLPALHSVKV